MKFYLLIITCLLFSFQLLSQESGDKINWMSWDEAMEANENEPKKIFIDMYTDWCGWCKRMDNTTFKEEKVVAYMNEHFYAIKFDAEQKEEINFNGNVFKFLKTGSRNGVHELAYALLDGRLGYPSFVALDEDYARIFLSPGYKGSDKLIKELSFATDEKYKSQSFEEFMNKGE